MTGRAVREDSPFLVLNRKKALIISQGMLYMYKTETATPEC